MTEEKKKELKKFLVMWNRHAEVMCCTHPRTGFLLEHLMEVAFGTLLLQGFWVCIESDLADNMQRIKDIDQFLETWLSASYKEE